MDYAKRFLMVTGVVALAVMVGSLAAPKPTHALVAALVQVTNTVANPVPVTDVTAQQPFQQSCTGVVPDPAGSQYSCQIQLPLGKRLVVETIGMGTTVNASTLPLQFAATAVLNGNSTTLVLNVPPGQSTGFNNSLVQTTSVQSVRLYADAGSALKCSADYNGSPNEFTVMYCVAIGYLVDVP